MLLLCRPDGYIADMQGNFNSNGMHNDGKLIKHMVNNNINGLCDYINPEEYLLVLDRGFQELFDDEFRYDFIMPSLSKAKPVNIIYFQLICINIYGPFFFDHSKVFQVKC